MNWLFDDDICWCANSAFKDENGCDNTDCFRHLSHRRHNPYTTTDIFTQGTLKGTPDCPYHKEKAEKITFGWNKWYCSNCRTLIDIEDDFCPNCGRKFIQSMNEYL